jgi:Tol biopolymer transport system component
MVNIHPNLKLVLRLFALTCVAILTSCGGGGSGGDGSSGNGPGGGATAARKGSMAYSFIDKVYSVDMATNQARTVLQQNYNESYVGAGVGPNGEIALAFNSSTSRSSSRLTIVRTDGSTEVSTRYDFAIEGQPKFSADGRQLAFTVSVPSGSTKTVFAQVVSRDGAALYFFRDVSRPAWMPDGRVVVYDVADRNLYLSGTDFRTPLTLVPNSSNSTSHAVSPDGASITLVRTGAADTRRHVFMMNIDGSGTRQVTTSTDGEETWAMFSPDGKELLVLSSGCVTVGGNGIGAGSVDDDLIHIIPANAQMLAIDRDRTTAPTRLPVDGGSVGRCVNAPPSWR